MNLIFGTGTKKEEVKEMLNNGAVIVDVRSVAEFRGGHVSGSKNIPLDEISAKADQISKMNKPVVLCCASGMRSAQATKFLKSKGVDCVNGGGWLEVNSMI